MQDILKELDTIDQQLPDTMIVKNPRLQKAKEIAKNSAIDGVKWGFWFTVSQIVLEVAKAVLHK